MSNIILIFIFIASFIGIINIYIWPLKGFELGRVILFALSIAVFAGACLGVGVVSLSHFIKGKMNIGEIQSKVTPSISKTEVTIVVISLLLIFVAFMYLIYTFSGCCNAWTPF